ncbi:Ras family protein, partial [Trichinella nativa]
MFFIFNFSVKSDICQWIISKTAGVGYGRSRAISFLNSGLLQRHGCCSSTLRPHQLRQFHSMQGLSWLADVKENSLECAFICLVGSKLDLQGKRVVKFEEAIKMAQDFNLSYIETSSKTGENVNALFYITA